MKGNVGEKMCYTMHACICLITKHKNVLTEMSHQHVKGGFVKKGNMIKVEENKYVCTEKIL